MALELSCRALSLFLRQGAEFAETDIFRAKVIDVTPKSFTLEATGSPSKIEAILELLRPLGLKELVRTGAVAIGRGAKGWKG